MVERRCAFPAGILAASVTLGLLWPLPGSSDAADAPPSAAAVGTDDRGRPSDDAAAGGDRTAASKPGQELSPASIEIRNIATSWDNLSELFSGGSMANPFSEGSVFVIRGELINRSGSPVHHVLLRYELLGPTGEVVHDLEGYNRLAEAMRPDESGKVDSAAVRSIPPRGSDTFRMVFFSEEIPRFSSHRVRVIEVHGR
ncbi:MAG TPA: hypothetical protein VEC57_09820 [Candidatus Limnocylindrales bacterium]|nr:hypothetical protein [Candidatus Limnocylindrales bacterium]